MFNRDDPSTISANMAERLAERVAAELAARLAQPLTAGLYLVATPIGNLGDITLNALAVMARVDRLYCEDTRQSLKLLQRYGLEKHLDTYHEHNAERERPRIMAALAAGQSVALISDAGTPLISDPGYKLVRAAVDADHAVHAIPGASAVLAGLVGSGLPTDSFHFAGFLPHKGGQRRNRIVALAAVPGTLVVFEAPGRLAACLADLAAGLGARTGVVGRELTKLNETYHRGTLPELADWAAAREIKGEAVILIGPGLATEVDDAAIVQELEVALGEGSVRDAASAVATRLGVPRRRVYDLAIALQNGRRATDQRPGDD